MQGRMWNLYELLRWWDGMRGHGVGTGGGGRPIYTSLYLYTAAVGWEGLEQKWTEERDSGGRNGRSKRRWDGWEPREEEGMTMLHMAVKLTAVPYVLWSLLSFMLLFSGWLSLFLFLSSVTHPPLLPDSCHVRTLCKMLLLKHLPPTLYLSGLCWGTAQGAPSWGATADPHLAPVAQSYSLPSFKCFLCFNIIADWTMDIYQYLALWEKSKLTFAAWANLQLPTDRTAKVLSALLEPILLSLTLL